MGLTLGRSTSQFQLAVSFVTDAHVCMWSSGRTWAPPGTASASTHECDAGEGLKSGMSLQVFTLLIEGSRIKKASAVSSNHWTPSHWNNVTSSKSLKASLTNLNSTFGWYLLMEWLRNWSTWCCYASSYASLSLVCSETKAKTAQEETHRQRLR